MRNLNSELACYLLTNFPPWIIFIWISIILLNYTNNKIQVIYLTRKIDTRTTIIELQKQVKCDRFDIDFGKSFN